MEKAKRSCMKKKLHVKGGIIDELIRCYAKTIVHFAIDRGELNVLHLPKTTKGVKVPAIFTISHF